MKAYRATCFVLLLAVGCGDDGSSDSTTTTIGTTTGAATQTSTATGDDSTTSATSESGSTSGSDPTTDSATDSASGTTGSVMLCEQELLEPNDTEVIAEDISVGDCGFDRDGAVGDTDPFDFYRLLFDDACLTSPASITVNSGPDLEICMIFRCTDGNTPNVLCGGGATADPSGEQCCHNDDFSTEFGCPAGDPVVFLRARSQNDECQPYVFRWDGNQ